MLNKQHFITREDFSSTILFKQTILLSISMPAVQVMKGSLYLVGQQEAKKSQRRSGFLPDDIIAPIIIHGRLQSKPPHWQTPP